MIINGGTILHRENADCVSRDYRKVYKKKKLEVSESRKTETSSLGEDFSKVLVYTFLDLECICKHKIFYLN
jgi:hypothetical protein